MKYFKAIIVLVIIAYLINCDGKHLKTEVKLSPKAIFSIEEKRFLMDKLDSTINFPFVPGDSIEDDLNRDEKEKYILTHDAAHKYKLISIQKKTGNYIAVIILYVMEGGNKQYMITMDKNENAISDLLIHNNHKDGPLPLKDSSILMLSTVNSYFKGDTIIVVERKCLSAGFLEGDKQWEEVIRKKYLIAENGRFEHLN